MYLRVHRHPASEMESVWAWVSGQLVSSGAGHGLARRGLGCRSRGSLPLAARPDIHSQGGPALPAGSVVLAGCLGGCYLIFCSTELIVI